MARSNLLKHTKVTSIRIEDWLNTAIQRLNRDKTNGSYDLNRLNGFMFHFVRFTIADRFDCNWLDTLSRTMLLHRADSLNKLYGKYWELSFNQFGGSSANELATPSYGKVTLPKYNIDKQTSAPCTMFMNLLQSKKRPNRLNLIKTNSRWKTEKGRQK